MKPQMKSAAAHPSPSTRHARRQRSVGWRLPINPAAAPPARIEQVDGGCIVIGLAAIAAAPHRSDAEALELAQRIAGTPSEYLPAMLLLAMPGITDLRPFPRFASKGGRRVVA